MGFPVAQCWKTWYDEADDSTAASDGGPHLESTPFARRVEQENEAMDQIITISREYGAGGRSVGKLVAQELGLEFYDRDIVRETVKASGFDAELVQEEGEDITKGSSILKSILASSVYYPDSQEAIHDVQRAIILHYAQSGPCVILGRCADEILRENGIPCLNVFLYASDIYRAAWISQDTGIKDPTEIQRIMAKKDNSRRNYYTHYTGKRWGDCSNYHLSLDTGVLGYELSAKLIVEAARAV
jgi:cytidylate kinase